MVLYVYLLQRLNHSVFCCASVAQFGCLAWSPCEKKLLYVAEKKRVEPSAHSSFALANEDGGQVLLEEQVICLSVKKILIHSEFIVYTGHFDVTLSPNRVLFY